LAKDFNMAVLLDFYGDILTQKQRDFMGYYYNDDLSQSEIAVNEGITRQGVRDLIKRTEAQLTEIENSLGLVRQFGEIRRGLDEIIACAGEINDYNLRYSLSREINERAARITSIAQSLVGPNN